MSTLGQPHFEPAWKKEVSRRLAEHKNRTGATGAAAPAEPHKFGSSRAAEAAARVAQRYAKAPSYSQMQAEEARMAVRAAEIATKVALEAQDAAESALADMHAAAGEQPSRGPAVIESITRAARLEPQESAVEAHAEVFASAVAVEAEVEFAPEFDSEAGVEVAPEGQPSIVIAPPEPDPAYLQEMIASRNFGIRWEPDTPVRVLQSRPAAPAEEFELDREDWWTPAQDDATLRDEPIEFESQQTQANLIEFPRELVATRKMRPRLAEPVQTAAERQLSIFEVDPGSVSTEPGSAAAVEDAPTWTGADWSGIELDEHPHAQERPQPAPAKPAHRIDLAPLSRRAMATAVDGCLILGSFFAATMMMAAQMQQAPAPRTAEAMVVVGVALVGILYNALFFALGFSTPGMRYAGIALSTFDDDSPNRAQLQRRLGAMILSLIPVGLGMAWALFDEDHLSWHDRISQTYLRKR